MTFFFFFYKLYLFEWVLIEEAAADNTICWSCKLIIRIEQYTVLYCRWWGPSVLSPPDIHRMDK